MSRSISNNSRAGVKENIRRFGDVHTETVADMRKVRSNQGGPDMSEYDKSPMMVNGRVEMFVSSSVLISKWEESEKEMSKVMEKGEKGTRRRSRRMDEL